MSDSADASSAPQLFVERLSDKARFPTRGSAFAAGYDFVIRVSEDPQVSSSIVS
ncbi:hypothetical protein EDC04DRAFT_2757854 [Pisolithus marmoratus]|nr:hypothetical protein EDC04DRAFT_2757854 [Pisolithus marmoratus]